MTPRSLLLCGLVFFSFLSNVSSPMWNSKCCRFVEDFPVRLRKLRENYKNIKGYCEANDDLDAALLDQSVQDSFNSPFACHTMNSILKFYLETVLPTALSEETEDIRDMESIQHMFDQVKADLTGCSSHIFCFLLLRSYIENTIAATLLQCSGQHPRQHQEENIWDTRCKAPNTQDTKKLYGVTAERGADGGKKKTQQ